MRKRPNLVREVSSARPPRPGGDGPRLLGDECGPCGRAEAHRHQAAPRRTSRRRSRRASMFLDEARISTRLNHPNIVQTNEVVDDEDDLYLVMEFLDGQPLSRILEPSHRDALPLAAKLRILVEALEGLHYAHELTDYDGTPLNVVHRDVSPQNIIVTYDGHVKLVDFGVAKAADATTVTESGVFKGKVRYSSPGAGAVRDRRSPGGRIRRRDDPLGDPRRAATLAGPGGRLGAPRPRVRPDPTHSRDLPGSSPCARGDLQQGARERCRPRATPTRSRSGTRSSSYSREHGGQRRTRPGACHLLRRGAQASSRRHRRAGQGGARDLVRRGADDAPDSSARPGARSGTVKSVNEGRALGRVRFRHLVSAAPSRSRGIVFAAIAVLVVIGGIAALVPSQEMRRLRRRRPPTRARST